METICQVSTLSNYTILLTILVNEFLVKQWEKRFTWRRDTTNISTSTGSYLNLLLISSIHFGNVLISFPTLLSYSQ
nr:MAG TPA: hypothetical protein [Bacteriophage sp.]